MNVISMKMFISSMALAFFYIPSFTSGESVCSRFDIGGPCDLMSTSTVITPELSPLESYCVLACATNKPWEYYQPCQCDSGTTTTEGPCTRSYLEAEVCEGATQTCSTNACIKNQISYQNIIDANDIDTCDCALQEDSMTPACLLNGTELTICLSLRGYNLLPDGIECDCYPTFPTTTVITTTEELIRHCYYTHNRTATFSNKRRKRMFEGEDVSASCEYPGIVGFFSNPGTTSQSAMCMGFLLSEDTVLFSKFCSLYLQYTPGAVALVGSNDIADVTADLPGVDSTSFTQLSAVAGQEYLYTATLTESVTFDGACIEPVCFPNAEITASTVDFSNCHVLGYGDVTTTTGSSADTLQEVTVFVSESSISNNFLTLSRLDTSKTTACPNDYGAPLMCAIADSDEWVAAGFAKDVGNPCSSGKASTFQSFFKEAFGGYNTYYEALQSYPYVNTLE